MPGAADLREVFADGRHSWSFEFFPPKTDEGEQQLWQAIRELERLKPTFVSVTYGAGGSTRDRTVRLTGDIAHGTTLSPVGHLTCVDASVADLRHVVGAYAAAGVQSILALRGDPQGGLASDWRPHRDGLAHAAELVALIKHLGDFGVGVAAFPEGHPESPDLEFDAQMLARKVDAGADFAVTQFFFEASSYFGLVERSSRHGVDVPIVPGLMPVTNVSQIERFAALSGTPLPAGVLGRLDPVRDDPSAVRAVGIELATELAMELLAGGAPGLHFYTLNRSTATREIYDNLDLSHRR